MNRKEYEARTRGLKDRTIVWREPDHRPVVSVTLACAVVLMVACVLLAQITAETTTGGTAGGGVLNVPPFVAGVFTINDTMVVLAGDRNWGCTIDECTVNNITLTEADAEYLDVWLFEDDFLGGIGCVFTIFAGDLQPLPWNITVTDENGASWSWDSRDYDPFDGTRDWTDWQDGKGWEHG